MAISERTAQALSAISALAATEKNRDTLRKLKSDYDQWSWKAATRHEKTS